MPASKEMTAAGVAEPPSAAAAPDLAQSIQHKEAMVAAADEPQRTSGGITTNGHHAPAQPQEPAQPLEDEREVMRDFRDAFSHLTRPEDSICAWLTERQKAALARLFKFKGWVPKEHWNLSQLDATPEELKQVEEFRELMEKEGHLEDEHARAYCGDLTLLRYLRARDHHLPAAHYMLVHSLAWRKENKPWAMENVSSRTNKGSSDERIVGFDTHGRLVVYSSFSNTNERQPDIVTVNAACMMEKCNQCIAAGQSGQVIWVNHFCGRHKRGFGWSDANPRFIFSGVHVFMNNFPENLRTMVIVDPPSIFFGLWKLLRPVLPPKTQQKGEFVDSRQVDAMRELFLHKMGFGEELSEHLMELIAKDNAIP